MNWEQISSVLRHILTFGGGFIIAKGWISAESMPGIIGAIITVGGVIWGMFTKTDAAVAASAQKINGVDVVTTPAASAAVQASVAAAK
jgi:hypothetical protein